MRRLALTLLLPALALLPLAVALGGCDLGGDDDQGTTSAQAAPAPAAQRPSPGISRAELRQHVAARLEDAGWRVTRQEVPFTYFALNDASLEVGRRELERGRDFQVLSYSAS